MPVGSAKVAVLTGPRQIEVREVTVSAPGPDEVQIATLFSGISAGAEMNVYRGRAPQWRLRLDPSTRLFAHSEKPDWELPAHVRLRERGSGGRDW